MSRYQSAIFAVATTLYAECRAEFEDYLEALYAAAEEATRGSLLNDRGRRGGIDPRSLLYGSRIRLLAYGSEELVQFIEHRGHLTYSAFERTWISGRLDFAS